MKNALALTLLLPALANAGILDGKDDFHESQGLIKPTQVEDNRVFIRDTSQFPYVFSNLAQFFLVNDKLPQDGGFEGKIVGWKNLGERYYDDVRIYGLGSNVHNIRHERSNMYRDGYPAIGRNVLANAISFTEDEPAWRTTAGYVVGDILGRVVGNSRFWKAQNEGVVSMDLYEVQLVGKNGEPMSFQLQENRFHEAQLNKGDTLHFRREKGVWWFEKQ